MNIICEEGFPTKMGRTFRPRRVPCGLHVHECRAKENPRALNTPQPHRCRSRAHRDDPLYL